jgi:acyl-CoA synthetase (AMP-forming)/AMP-acid ligase II
MFRARLLEDPDNQEWLRTGDLGFLHGGELYVCGRLKDLIIVNGRNMYPQDIERSIEANHSSLRPGCSAAFALEVDGVEQLVVMAEVRQVHETPELCRDILTAIEAAILEEHGLRCYALLLVRQGQVPKTTSGKIKRFACKEAAQTWLDQRGEEASGSASWGCCDSRESSSLEFEVCVCSQAAAAILLLYLSCSCARTLVI